MVYFTSFGFTCLPLHFNLLDQDRAQRTLTYGQDFAEPEMELLPWVPFA
jgi:hypothetical protein